MYLGDCIEPSDDSWFVVKARVFIKPLKTTGARRDLTTKPVTAAGLVIRVRLYAWYYTRIIASKITSSLFVQKLFQANNIIRFKSDPLAEAALRHLDLNRIR